MRSLLMSSLLLISVSVSLLACRDRKVQSVDPYVDIRMNLDSGYYHRLIGPLGDDDKVSGRVQILSADFGSKWTSLLRVCLTDEPDNSALCLLLEVDSEDGTSIYPSWGLYGNDGKDDLAGEDVDMVFNVGESIPVELARDGDFAYIRIDHEDIVRRQVPFEVHGAAMVCSGAECRFAWENP